VNPSLWRQTQLMAVGGLFQVTDRVYQVRSKDAYVSGATLAAVGAAGAMGLKAAQLAKRADLPLAVSTVIVLQLLNLVAVPLWAGQVVSGASISAVTILKDLLELVLIPLAIGLAVRWRYPDHATSWQPDLVKVANLALGLSNQYRALRQFFKWRAEEEECPGRDPGFRPQLWLGAGLPTRVMDVHGWQVLHLLLSEVEPDTVIDPGHGTDRDGHFLTAPHVSLLEEHVGHVVAFRVDDQPLDFPDVAVGGMDVLTATHLHLVQRDGVVGDRQRSVSPGHAHAHAHARARAVVGHEGHLFRVIARVSGRAGQELRLLGGIELLELRQGAAEPDLARRGVDKVKRNKPAAVIVMLWFDHEMGDRTRDRVHDHAGHLAAAPVSTADVGPDRERRCLCHGHPSRS